MKFTIARKLWLSFSILSLLLIAVALMGVVNLNRAYAAVDKLKEVHKVLEALDRSTEYMLLERVKITQYVTTGEETHAIDAESAGRAHEEMWAIVQAHGAGKNPDLIKDLEQFMWGYNTLLDKAVGVYEENPDDLASALAVLNQADQFLTHIVEPANKQLHEYKAAEVEEAEASLDRLFTTTRAVAIVASALALTVAIALAYTISSGITRAVVHLSAAAESISRGDLDMPIEVKTGDEMQALAESIERMRTSLKAAIERLRARRIGA
jgi:HAMP domain-containing protein